MPLTDLGAVKALDSMLGTAHAAGWPPTLYVGLSTTDPETSPTEPTGGYARVGIPNDDAHWTVTGDRSKTNAVVVQYPTAAADWGTLAWWLLYDQSTAGTLLGYGGLVTEQTVRAGDTPSIPPENLIVTII
jgi:hypothetical protein